MRELILGAALLSLAACNVAEAQTSPAATKPVEAPSGTYANDPAHTSLTWKIGHMGLSNYTARMSDVKIALQFDAADVEKSTVSATINAASFDTGYPGKDKDFNAEIASDLIMKASQFPTITFKSKSVQQTSPTTANIMGDLTMMGVTKPVTLSATYNGSMASHPFIKVPAIGFSAKTVIDRTEFGNTFLSGSALADKVEIVIETELLKK